MKKITLSRDNIVEMVRCGSIKIQEGALMLKLVNGRSLSTKELASQVAPIPPVSVRSHTMRIRGVLLGLAKQGYVQQAVSTRNSVWALA